MTPKEKAEELFSNYRFCLSIPNAPLGDLKDSIAKEAALIAVAEILDNFCCKVGDKTHYCNYLTIQYYEEVETELNKL